MLIEELFGSGIMTMGVSRHGPQRQVGVFSTAAREKLTAPGDLLASMRWMDGEWAYENPVPPTKWSPAYTDTGTQRFTVTGDRWVAMVLPDGRGSQCLRSIR